MIKKPPTHRQRQIIAFIEGFIEENGFPPTVREIGKGVGLASSSTVHSHLVRLEKKEMITFLPGSARSIRLLQKTESFKQELPEINAQALTEENEYLRSALKEIKESTIGYTLPTRFEKQLNEIIDDALKGETA